MGDQQDCHIVDQADRLPSAFVIDDAFLDTERKWIIEHSGRQFETHAVFRAVGSTLDCIPLDVHTFLYIPKCIVDLPASLGANALAECSQAGRVALR